MTLKMTTAQVVETSVTVTNSSFQNYTHPDDHTTRTTDTPGFKPFTKNTNIKLYLNSQKSKSFNDNNNNSNSSNNNNNNINNNNNLIVIIVILLLLWFE